MYEIGWTDFAGYRFNHTCETYYDDPDDFCTRSCFQVQASIRYLDCLSTKLSHAR